jgi:hypothetical protein
MYEKSVGKNKQSVGLFLELSVIAFAWKKCEIGIVHKWLRKHRFSPFRHFWMTPKKNSYEMEIIKICTQCRLKLNFPKEKIRPRENSWNNLEN